MEPQSPEFKPPYMSFQTFWKFTEELANKPLPPRIDRSLMSGKSGTDQANLTSALVSFGLMEPDGTVTSRLQQFASGDQDDRKKMLAEMVEEFYPRQLAVSAANATSNALHDSFRDSFGLSSPETRRKCETFFLHALRLADLPFSHHFPQIRSGSGGPGVPKKRPARKKPAAATASPPIRETFQEPDDDPAERDGSGVYKQAVTLRTGGTMTLSVSVNPLTLRGADRDFFYQIVDALADYAEGSEDPQP
ncbi:DUF5343 domain-containing protein [Blastococcus sp. TF02A-26]|uniref:DUF5343 domain-containing protein n=1 Tax=Blastococcus sp. TF02A-26 TaxID=2250577 RepID=UPI000DEBB049|nr:DUF5343 domain-containing protein [Blastococcus sp. TF02A-26]RBY83196.1 hypothetical protein DQ240_17500 [Blastococcus sp. TF02A-26]